jgi:CubicO group peptidase (beta-lactamase class C family)
MMASLFHLSNLLSMKTILTLCWLLAASFAQSQSRQDKDLISQIDKTMASEYQRVAPGCVLLIAKKGKLLYEKGFGLANLELNVPMKPEMVFRVGSITKQFTAVAILQLVEKGKLALTDSIQQYISRFRYKGNTITIRHLLTHTSGIKGYEEIDAKVPNAIRVDFAAATVIDSLDKLPLDFAPGTRYQYSNSNYFLLGSIIEKVSGKTYPQYLQENIFNVIGLSSTFYESQSAIIPNRVSGYSLENEQYRNAGYISMSLVYSAGALLSNAADLYQWHQALYQGKLISKQNLQAATTPHQLSNGQAIEYGYGWFIRNDNGLLSIGHGGAIDGFRAIENYFPEQDVYMVLLCNAENDRYQSLFQQVADIVLDRKTEPGFQEIKLSDAVLDSYVGTYKNEQYNVSIKVYRANGRIYGDLSNGTGSYMMFMAKTETEFLLPDVKRVKTTAQFVKEGAKAVKLILMQERPVEFVRVE